MSDSELEKTLGEFWPIGEKLLQAPVVGPSLWKEPPLPLNVEEIDSGHTLQIALNLYLARIRQLKAEVAAFKKESDNMVDTNLIQTLELITLNKNLEYKVKERTLELEKANEKLQELSQAKEALMHMIVHDMKNPLTAILGTLLLFDKNSFGLKTEIHQLLIHAHTQGIKLLSMIEQILMISRMQTKEFQLKPQHANLIAVVQQSLDLMSRTSGAQNLVFKFNPPGPELRVVMDVEIIERVLNNLLNNAIKYSPPAGEILIQIELVENQVSVRISNWGKPIPAQDQKRIFELFTRVVPEDKHFSGTGLGLAFCQLAVEAHGGTIQVISPLSPDGRGSCFNFFLPLNIG